MTAIEKIQQMDTATITPDMAAKVLQCNPISLRVAARQRPELLGFPVIVMGTRVRIPRIPFLNFLNGGHANA